MEKIERWQTGNGNKCFRFAERKVFERPWIIILAALLLTLGSGVEYFAHGSYYSLTPNVILLFFLLLWWTTIPLKANEAVIEKTVHELMDEIVAADAKAAGTEVVKSFVHYDAKGTYAIITGRCFLVLLKNDEVWEYPIEYHKPNKKTEGHYECMIKHIVSDNQEHIRAILPRRWHGFVEKLKLPVKTKLWFYLLAIIFIGGVAFAGVYWLIMRLGWWLLLVIGGYLFVYELVEWIAKQVPGRFTGVCRNIISLPMAFIYILASLAQPFITIAGTYLLIALFAFGVPTLVLVGITNMGWIVFKPETIAFIAIALGSVLSSTYFVTKWIIRLSPLKNWGNHDYESCREQLAFYLVHPSNMVFVLYLLYFVLLAVSGYMLIQDGEYLISKSFDMAILKAFLVYIAYTNMKVKAKETEVEAKVLLERISGLFVHDKYE